VLDRSDVLLIPAGPDGVTPGPDNAPLPGNALELVNRLDVVLGELA